MKYVQPHLAAVALAGIFVLCKLAFAAPTNSTVLMQAAMPGQTMILEAAREIHSS